MAKLRDTLDSGIGRCDNGPMSPRTPLLALAGLALAGGGAWWLLAQGPSEHHPEATSEDVATWREAAPEHRAEANGAEANGAAASRTAERPAAFGNREEELSGEPANDAPERSGAALTRGSTQGAATTPEEIAAALADLQRQGPPVAQEIAPAPSPSAEQGSRLSRRSPATEVRHREVQIENASVALERTQAELDAAREAGDADRVRRLEQHLAALERYLQSRIAAHEAALRSL